MNQARTSTVPTGGRTILRGVRLGAEATPVDMVVDGGMIAGIAASGEDGGGIVLPLFCDIHVHLDKTFTVDRTGDDAQSLFHAAELMEADKRHWTAEDIHRRATRGMNKAYRHGVVTLRSHVDWVTPDVPPAWDVLNEIRREWRGRIDLQLAALVPLDLMAEAGPSIARRVKADDGVLGAFIYRNDHLVDKVRGVFSLADRHDLPLDFHVDEGLEPEARGFEAIVTEAERLGHGRPVLCGHVCSLSVHDGTEAATLLERAASAGIGLVTLPTANGYLQDRRAGRTPRRRGLAPLHEARRAGMEVMLASDNVADVFYPYGDYDPFDVFRHGVAAGHLRPEDWLDAIGETAHRWSGTEPSRLSAGARADFVRFEATDLRDLIARAAARREVWRAGAPLETMERSDDG